MERKEKKKRICNFSEVEKTLLVDLISEKKHIIENKVTNSASIQAKEKCWEDITNTFNSTSSFARRDAQSLQNCWGNIKKRTRKFFAEERKEMYKTGGGQYHFEENSLCSKTREIIKSSVDGMLNEVDCDYDLSVVCDTHKENVPPPEDTSCQDAEMDESAIIDLLDDSKEYEVEYLSEHQDIYLRSCEKEINSKTNALKAKVSAGDEALNPSTSIDGNKTTVRRNLNRKKQQSQKKINRFYDTTVPKTTRESSNQKIAQFTKLAQSKVVLSELLTKNEMKRHSIEMAIAEQRLIREKLEVDIAEQRLIREKLEVDVLKKELETKKTILMREKSRNSMLGMLTENE